MTVFRAKDAEKLLAAIETKIRAQAEYVVWRDSKVIPSQKSGGRISVLQSGLPEADPGAVVAHRWRKKLCSDGAIDDDKLGRARILAVLSGQEWRRGCPQVRIGTAEGECLAVCRQVGFGEASSASRGLAVSGAIEM